MTGNAPRVHGPVGGVARDERRKGVLVAIDQLKLDGIGNDKRRLLLFHGLDGRGRDHFRLAKQHRMEAKVVLRHVEPAVLQNVLVQRRAKVVQQHLLRRQVEHGAQHVRVLVEELPQHLRGRLGHGRTKMKEKERSEKTQRGKEAKRTEALWGASFFCFSCLLIARNY